MFNFIKNLLSSKKPKEEKPSISPAAKKPADVYKPPRAKKPTSGTKNPAKKSTVSKTDLDKMTKKQLEDYAKKEFKVDLDRRKKKTDLVEEVVKLSKKSSN